MRCPNCGGENPEGSVYCNLCFRNFSEKQDAGPVEQSGAQPFSSTPGGAYLQPPAQAQAPSPPPGPGMPPPPPMGPGIPPPAFQQPAPSDAYGYGWAQGPPRPAGPITRGKAWKMNPVVQAIVTIIVVALSFAGGWYLTGLILNGPKTYTSATSDISFTYPGKWKKVSADAFAISSPGMMTYNEIILADAKQSNNASYFLAVGSLPGGWGTDDWNKIKTDVGGRLATVDKSVPAGVTVTTPTLTDLTIAGEPAASVRFSLSSAGMTFDCDATFFKHGANGYMMFFLTQKPKGNSAKFAQILKSVKLKAAATP